MLSSRVARRLAVSFFAVVLASSAPAFAQIALIDFEADTSGNEFAGGEKLRFEYSTMGLTFSAVGAGGTCNDVYANKNHPGDFGSPTTLISLCPPPWASDISENGMGLIRIRFEPTVVGSCIQVRPDGASDYAVMRAYDAAGNEIDEEFSSAGVTETLCVSGQRIRTVEFSGAANRYCRFDNLSVTYGGGPGPQTRYLPAGANQPGAGTTQWNTDLEVTNLGLYDMDCTVELLEWDQANMSPKSASFTVEPDTSVRVDDALDSLFSYFGAGTLRVLGLGGSLHATARTYNTDPDGTYGQYIAGLQESEGITPGRSGLMTQLSQSPNNQTGFRTNLGLVSAVNFSITVIVELYDADGTLLVSEGYPLDPYESIQINKIFRTLGGTSLDDGYIIVRSDTPQALFFAYASVVDNGSGDGMHVPATLR